MTLMRLMYLLAGLTLGCPEMLIAQPGQPSDQAKRKVVALIDRYTQARDNRDTTLLKQILTRDIDQLVSTGEWRTGMRAAVDGMLTSSASNPGDRTLVVDKIKFLSPRSAVADCRYEIKNSDGTIRRMWSSFILVSEGGTWKISGIRNMLPSR